MKAKYSLYILLPLLSASNAMASITLGAGGAVSSAIYNEKNKTVYSPLPIINYESDYFYINNTDLGVYLYKDDSQSISLLGSYDSQEFNPKDAVKSLSKVSKRNSTVFSGLEYSLQTPAGLLTTSVLQDILGKSKGMKVDTSWSYSIVEGQWSFTPGVGIQWNSKKQNNYYYGVDRNEAVKSGVTQYDAKSSITPYTNITLTYSFDENWTAALFADGRFITQEQRDSPLTSDKKVLYSVGASISYTF